VTDEVQNLKTKDVMMCCLIRAITYLRRSDKRYGAMIISKRKLKKLKDKCESIQD
jgi:hypothetical protein